MNPVFEGKIRTRNQWAFRDKEKSLLAKGFCWHVAGAKYTGNNPGGRILLSSVFPHGGVVYGVCIRAGVIGRRILLARTAQEFDRFPGEEYSCASAALSAHVLFLRDRAADIAKEEAMIPAKRAIVRTTCGGQFKSKEKMLLNSGARWVHDGKTLEGRIEYPVPGTSEDPYAILVHFYPRKNEIFMQVVQNERKFAELVPSCEVYETATRMVREYKQDCPDAILRPWRDRSLEKQARLAEGYGKGFPEIHNKEAITREEALRMAMQYAPVWVGVDFAKFKNYEVPVMKPYTLKARASEQSIDFYEVSETLTRQHPIAFLTAGSKEGYVLVHKQLLRQAEGKRNSIKLPRKASETDQKYTLRLADVTSKLAVPGQRQSYPWKFGNAFAFHVDSPSEFPIWKKWAQHVRQARWNVEEREYKVTFPEV